LPFFFYGSYIFNVMKYTNKGSHAHNYIINTTPFVSLVILVTLVDNYAYLRVKQQF